jgi:uncharacterized metal-binding protein YceD (DUF177 family)
VIFHDLSTEIEYEGKISKVAIGNFERTFKTQLDPLDPDDVQKIENAMIDLSPVIREELIMATYSI